MFKAFEAANAPEGLLLALRAVHEEVWALQVGTSAIVFLYAMQSGVLQGCPLSGSVFAVSFDGPLRMLALRLGSAGLVLACADDVLLVLRAIQSMFLIAQIFQVITLATALKVNFSKCVAVPLWRTFSMHTKASLRTSLTRWAPEWASIAIEGFTTFLGYAFGPGATPSDIWRAALEKYKTRSRLIISSTPPPSVGANLLRSRADSVLQYLGQLLEPPAELRALEAQYVGKLLHAPGKTLSRAMVARAPQFLRLDVGLPSAGCWAALARSTSRTFISLLPEALDLKRAAELHGGAARFFKGHLSPPFWKSPCIAARLLGVGEPVKASSDTFAFPAALAASRRARTELREKPQRLARAAWLDARFPLQSLRADFRRRFSLLLGPSLADAVVDRWDDLTKGVKPHTVHCAVRTLLNGWPDQHRMHESDHDDCLFGCADGRDSLQAHYFANCPSLLSLVLHAWSTRVAPSEIQSCWAARSRLDVLASMYSFYATISRDRRVGISSDVRESALVSRALHCPN